MILLEIISRQFEQVKELGIAWKKGAQGGHGAKSRDALKICQRDDHLGLMIRVFIIGRIRLMQLSGQRLVGMSLECQGSSEEAP